MINAFLVRFGEIFLKKGRSRYFMDRLLENIRRSLQDIEGVRVTQPYGRVLVTLQKGEDGAYPLFGSRATEISQALGRVFGVESYSPAVLCERSMEAFGEAAVHLVGRDLEQCDPAQTTFKIDTNRADKRFPGRSTELNAKLGGVVLDAYPELKVKLGSPDILVGVEIHEQFCCVTAGRERGPGGLPVGSSGGGLLLLSGGIDSPVAGWLAMKRGVRVDALYFHAFPYTGDQTKQKVSDLARRLVPWQGPIRLHIVDIGAFQKHCRDHAPGRQLVLLYRRQMMRIAEAIAVREGHKVLLTGESIGQVASQTLSNLGAIEAVTSMPVLRPLVTYDKQEAITLARRIGTYEISIQPFDDCCSLFVPSHPETKGTARNLEHIEGGLDTSAFMESALAAVEVLEIG